MLVGRVGLHCVVVDRDAELVLYCGVEIDFTYLC